MTDLLLVNPPQGDAIYQGLHAHGLTACEPPVWCRLIAGHIRDRGWTVEIIDAEALGLSPEDVANHVDRTQPRLTVIVAHGHQPSASTQTMAGALPITHAIRNRSLDHKIAICGAHPTVLPADTYRQADVNWVILGEGPLTIDALLRGEWSPPGIWTPYDQTPPPPLMPMESLHGQAWDLLPMDRYRAHNWQVMDGSPATPYASIVTTLGCPFKCSFCMINAPFGGSGYRMRRSQDVVDEVRHLHDHYGVNTFKIADEMFVLNPKHYLQICSGLARLPFADELNIWAYARVDTVKEHTLPVLRQAGIRWLALGIESGSKHVRDGADKVFTNDDIVSTVRAIQDADINVIGNFIYGLSDDTVESMQETLNLALDLNCEFTNHYSAMPYPGSRLYSETPHEHLPSTWAGYSQHSFDTRPLPTATLSSAEVLRFRDHAFQACFTAPRYIDMIGAKFGESAVQSVYQMIGYKLERKLLIGEAA